MVAWLPEVSPDAKQWLIEAARKSVSFQASGGKAWLGLDNLLLEAGLPKEAAETLLEATQRLASESQLFLTETQRQNGETDPAQIVLFPSFMTHATRPTGISDQRISIAFDVRPA